MLSTEKYQQIRKDKLNGVSMREIAKNHGVSRKTVAKYCEGLTMPKKSAKAINQKGNPTSKRGNRKSNIKDIILAYIANNKNYVSKKQQITRKMIWEHVNSIISVGYSTICRYYKEIEDTTPEIFVPLEFEPGEVMQVDWCLVYVDIAGVKHPCKLFCSVMGYSGKIFTMLLPNEQQDCFFYAHVAALNYFNGTPRIVFYDNPRTLVVRGAGKNAVTNESFKLLQAHYGFEARFMNPYRGNEKGLVENLCQTARKLAFTPIPKGNTLKEIQEYTHLKTDHYNNTHKKRYKELSIKEMAEKEKTYLFPLPATEYQAFSPELVTANKMLQFNYKSCRYSLPYEYSNKQILIQPTPYEIFCKCEGKLIAQHTISLVPNRQVTIVEHYLPILAKKRRSIPHAKPLKDGVLPPELDRFRSKCLDKDKSEQIVNLLLLCNEYGKTKVLKAVSKINQESNPTFDKVVKHLKVSINIENNIDDINDYLSSLNIDDNSIISQEDSLKVYDDLLTNEEKKN
ncbi:MAG: IS21 family transposase [Clostridiales Family XIII bacterium]|jgi:transposase|nr:IS21 family transposase [Clostridiales Family XIII bacterium]